MLSMNISSALDRSLAIAVYSGEALPTASINAVTTVVCEVDVRPFVEQQLHQGKVGPVDPF